MIYSKIDAGVDIMFDTTNFYITRYSSDRNNPQGIEFSIDNFKIRLDITKVNFLLNCSMNATAVDTEECKLNEDYLRYTAFGNTGSLLTVRKDPNVDIGEFFGFTELELNSMREWITTTNDVILRVRNID